MASRLEIPALTIGQCWSSLPQPRLSWVDYHSNLASSHSRFNNKSDKRAKMYLAATTLDISMHGEEAFYCTIE
jgi:hypothetical protein